MKKIFKALRFPLFFILFLSSFIACDEDFSTVESDVVGEENTNFSTGSIELPISVSNKKLDAVQINNLPSYLLGVFDDLDYGKTTASIVSQLTPNPTSLSKDFGTNPTIDSIVISIPFFSRVTGTNADNNSISLYKVDSLYSRDNENLPFKLSIYQNNYFLRDFNPSGNGNSSQAYFSKAEALDDPNHNFASNGSQQIDFDNHLGQLIFEDSEFKIKTEAIEIHSATDTTFVAPALRISLKTETEIAFWQQTIVDMRDTGVLDNANNFKNYFRGFYFKTESVDGKGSMILMNLASANASVTINYSKGEDDSRTQDEYVLNFSGNILNTFKNDFTTPLTSGDEQLYLKGLEGSMAVIDLFPNVGDLEDFKTQFQDEFDNQNSLINEAHLIIYEDDVLNPLDANENEYHKFDRIYAYDIKNNTPLIDYRIDPITNNTDALNSKVFSLGQRDDSGRYLLRITDHLNNIIQNDSTNTKIGLVLSTNVNLTNSSQILNNVEADVTGVPAASVISPRGTILHGTNSPNEEKRLKLEVFFTKPK